MFEKNLTLGYLLDFYGDVLSEQQRIVMNCYYNDDLSLAEIAEMRGISRQGVRHIIKKCEEELLSLEQKLGMAQQFKKMKQDRGELLVLLSRAQSALDGADMRGLQEALSEAMARTQELD